MAFIGKRMTDRDSPAGSQLKKIDLSLPAIIHYSRRMSAREREERVEQRAKDKRASISLAKMSWDK